MTTQRQLAAVRNSGAERKFLRIADVQAMTGLSRASIYRFAKRGEFPKPIKLSERTSAWLQSECAQWCEQRTAATREHREAA